MNIKKEIKNWDFLYKKGRQGKYPNEMLVRFINSKFTLQKRKKSKVLDLGFGTGRHLVFLAEEGFQTYGIEYSIKGEKIAQDWLKEKGLTAILKVGSAIEPFFEDQQFDAVIDIASIQHNTYENMKKIISNVHNILRPGGYFFSILKNKNDSLFKTGVKVQGFTYEFPVGVEKVINSTIISFTSYGDLLKLYSAFSNVQVEREEWTYNNMQKKVSHWIVTCQK